MVKNIKGCTHIFIKNGKVYNIVTHLSKIPKNGVIHLKGDKIYSVKEFKVSHPNDGNELKASKERINFDDF